LAAAPKSPLGAAAALQELKMSNVNGSKLNGKVAVVTGASKGIGAAIAKSLAAEGAAVVVNYSASKDAAEKVVAEIAKAGGKAIAVKADVADAGQVKTLFAEAEKAYGKLDILVNNAGVYDFQPVDEITADNFHRQFNINVLGTVLATQEALNHFRPDGGSVINLSSIAAANPPAGTSVYSATKAAIDALTKSHAKELGARNIRVNAIAPGGTETEGLYDKGIMGSEFMHTMIAGTPLGRLGRANDISGAAVFLASDDARWITGDKITVSGGLQ
jgi:3-oxoacyl-[acyl-carrier protein] reductase